MRRKQCPVKPDPRPDWMRAQAARCGCRGTDDLCACQNAEEPWKYGLGGAPPRLSTQVNWADFEDEIADAIRDSLDMDWTSSDGARAVVRLLTELQRGTP